MAKPSKVLMKNSGSSSQVIDLEGDRSQPSSPHPKGGRALRNRPTTPAKIVNEDMANQGEILGVQNDDAMTVAEIVVKDAFDSMATSELRKLAIGHEVKGLMLSHLLSVRQEKEVADAHAKVGHVEKTVSEIESRHATEKEKLSGEADVEDLEEANEALKQSMADEFVDGFWSTVDQVKALFPDLDQDTLAQIDVLKKVEDGKLVSRIPKAT
ncbi:hypothetical protein A2U01_0009985 [Trifolium medium]|uniref:Uncharacterized protein n=1 Tax=Trifolium medium TaxID=97028 RepID=A0A392MNH3_9FABA|nr:hypothetical protein [Trifolium medium]